MTKSDSLSKRNNIKLNKTLFENVKRLSDFLYLVDDDNSKNSKILNIVTNETLFEIRNSGSRYRCARGLKPNFVTIYDGYLPEKDRALYILDKLGRCIFVCRGTVSYLPTTHYVKNDKLLIFLYLAPYSIEITDIIVYDTLSDKIDKIIRNVVDIKLLESDNILNTASYNITYLENAGTENEKLTIERF